MFPSYKKHKKYAGVIILFCIILIIIFVLYQNINNETQKKYSGIESKNFNEELQDILKMQKSEGPFWIMDKNCEDFNDIESKEYCKEKQQTLKDIYIQ